jgi:hypothetical protein
MLRTVEAEIDEQGRVRLLEPLALAGVHRALVTILPAEGVVANNEAAVASEAALAKDWNRPEEDAAWSHLQQAPSS